MSKKKIRIMGLADTRLKGKGCKQLHKNYTLIHPGVDNYLRAKHGVAIIVEPTLAIRILETSFISERIISVRIKEQETTTYIQVYAPCNAANREEECGKFFDEVHDTINKIKRQDNS